MSDTNITKVAGNYGNAIAGDWGTATAGHYGKATAGHYGTAIAGDFGTAIAGTFGTAAAGNAGIIVIQWWCEDTKRIRLAVGYVGEDGIKANTPYRVENGKLVPVN